MSPSTFAATANANSSTVYQSFNSYVPTSSHSQQQQQQNTPLSGNYNQSLYENAISQYSQIAYNYNTGYNVWASSGSSSINHSSINTSINTVTGVSSPGFLNNETKLDKPGSSVYSNSNSSGYGMHPDAAMSYQFSNEFATSGQSGLNQFQQQHMFDYPNYLNSLQVNSVANGSNTNNTVVS